MNQLLLLPETQEQKFERLFLELKEYSEKVQRSQFAKISQLTKETQELKKELNDLKVSIGNKPQLPLFGFSS